MGFNLRKSVKLPGGIRLNLSSKGVGVSAGIKGMRVGVGPRGLRVNAGRGPLRYQKQISLSSPKSSSTHESEALERLVTQAAPPENSPQGSAATLLLKCLVFFGICAFFLTVLAIAINDNTKPAPKVYAEPPAKVTKKSAHRSR